jgi:DNA replication protein DnaC
MEDLLFQTCKRLRFGDDFIERAKKIKAKTHLDFLLKLFSEEAEERDRRRRNAYQKAAKFDILKTFENYTFEDIKFPNSLTADDIIACNFIPKHENLILYGNVGAGKTHLAIATGIAACDAGFKVRYWSTPRLVNSLIEAKKKG